MSDFSAATPLNPVPRSLLDQFLQELGDLGLTERQVDGHLVYLRLWQKFLVPQRLLDGTPAELQDFAAFLREQGLGRGDVRFAQEAVEHFYAFTLDRHPTWEERAAWGLYLEQAPRTRPVPLWQAIGQKFNPHLKRADPGWLVWGEP